MLNGSTDAVLSGLVVLCVAALAVVTWTLMRRGRKGRRPGARAGTDRKGWRELEPLLAQAFRLQGYQVIESARDRPRPDGELALRRGRETVLVQCREWGSAKVGVEVVHALHRAMTSQGAAGGFVLTTGRFARQAVAYAASCNVRLIDGPGLHGLIENAKTATDTTR